MRRLRFPDPETADDSGLVAITDGLDVDLLLEGYARGIFPWSEHPVRWYSPDPRAVFLYPHLRLPKRTGKVVRRHRLRVSFDTSFEAVMLACSQAHRHRGAWITPGFLRAYGELHRRGHAHSVEVWQDERLVGGLYGVQLGAMFAGESMFYRLPNASKVAFVALVEHLRRIGVLFIDAQVLNEHTQRLGAVLVRRRDFLLMLRQALAHEPRFDGEPWPPTSPAERAG